jgi:hypothetical protein
VKETRLVDPRHTTRAIGPILVALLLCLSAASAPADEPHVRRSDDALAVALGNGVELHFALHDGLLLGLRRADAHGVELTSGETVLRPVLAQEYADERTIWPLLRFESAEVADGEVRIEATLLGTQAEEAYRGFFVFRGDRQAALERGRTEKLDRLAERKQQAEAPLDAAVEQDETVRKRRQKLSDVEAKLAAAEGAGQKKLSRQRDQAQKKLRQARERARRELLKEDRFSAAAEAVAAYESELDRIALEFGDIHRDYYLLPHVRLPGDICRAETVKRLAGELGGRLEPGGTLTWHIRPAERNIAGWLYLGWQQRYAFELADGRQVNKLWQVGTWELGGEAPGLTVVALRYRGLGKIEQTLTAREDGGVAEAFTTTETLPGAVGEAPLVSPVVPAGRDVRDRAYALRHRTGAWIAQMARGAGAPFVDFQFRPGAVLVSFPERQGSLRALTEAMPGDEKVSQTDCEYFALTDEHRTVPQNVLVLTAREPLEVHQARTRWKEVDEHVREQVSRELGFVRREVMPGVGILYDNGWAGFYRDLADRYVEKLSGMGVRLIAVHNPGWVNGRYQGPDGPPDTGGGVCSVYDWWPTKDMVEPWKAFQASCAREGVAYYPWLGQTQWRDAPFVQRVGLAKEHWALNAPDAGHSSGYGPEHVQGNIADDRFRKLFLGQLERVHRQFGYQGFWCDSFQNLFMTQLNWSHGTGESLQRAWWERIAAWSRDGIGWMAESHSFPGMSCSIEVHGWEDQPWYFQHVFKWLRGNSQNEYTKDELAELVFRVMANKGWVAPDVSYNRPLADALPAFERLAKQYNAALPLMRRAYVLSGGRGVLWVGNAGNAEGVWFAFADGSCPEGVTARPVERPDAPVVDKVLARQTYYVSGRDLLRSFSVRTGRLDDPRVGRSYEPADYTWPAQTDTEGGSKP